MSYCHFPRCGDPIPARSLMCRRHWRQVPPDLREIWRHAVRDYEEDRDGDALLHNLGELQRLLAGES